MALRNGTASVSKGMLWAGRGISALVVLFMILDAVEHLMTPAPVVEAFVRLGLPLRLAHPLGIIGLFCVAAYAFPRTAALGAILLTGYLGGAVAINLRAGDPMFETLFPAIFGVLAWGGIWLRDERLRALIPLKGSAGAEPGRIGE